MVDWLLEYACHSDVVCDEICVIHNWYVWTVYAWALKFKVCITFKLCFIQMCCCCIQSYRGYDYMLIVLCGWSVDVVCVQWIVVPEIVGVGSVGLVWGSTEVLLGGVWWKGVGVVDVGFPGCLTNVSVSLRLLSVFLHVCKFFYYQLFHSFYVQLCEIFYKVFFLFTTVELFEVIVRHGGWVGTHLSGVFHINSQCHRKTKLHSMNINILNIILLIKVLVIHNRIQFLLQCINFILPIYLFIVLIFL